ncbi:MAG: serine/threonine-protein kinase [Planctomycetaceae bacterium]
MTEPKADLEGRDSRATAGPERDAGSQAAAQLPGDGAAPEAPSPPGSATPAGSSAASHHARITDLKDRELGDFKLLRRIGHGGMAEVYLAEQQSLKRNVAVKVLREEMHSDDVHLKRFEQEAKAAGGLNHPNIVQVYTIGRDEGTHYIAQEYVQGMNLREYLNRNGPPNLETALNFMRQVASALQAAGEAGIVHRDVKPENILITRRDDVKITDFGLAQLTLPGENLNLTQVGMTMGTPLYMSPEQVNGRKIDHRSDLYSFGVTSYHLLCGVTPFRGETALNVAIQHVNAEPPPLKQQRPDLPDVVCRVVHRMMAKNPDDRYQDAETLLADLDRIADALARNPASLPKLRLSEATIPGQAPRWLAPFLGWSLSRRLVTFAVSAIVVGGVAAAVGWWQRPVDPFETPPAKTIRRIKKLETAFDQYWRAMNVNDEESWKAVIEYFPSPRDRRFRLRARESLASLYVRKERYGEAEEIYRSFTIEDDNDDALKAAGYAGLAVVASLQGDAVKSQRFIIDKLNPLRRKGSLTNRELEQWVQEAERRNKKQ